MILKGHFIRISKTDLSVPVTKYVKHQGMGGGGNYLMFHIFGNNLGFKTTNNLYLTTLLIRVIYMAVINNIHINTQCVSHFDLETLHLVTNAG